MVQVELPLTVPIPMTTETGVTVCGGVLQEDDVIADSIAQEV